MKTLVHIWVFLALAGGWFALVDQIFDWYCRIFKKGDYDETNDDSSSTSNG